MNRGWVRLHRKIDENKYWLSEKFTRGQAWVDLLMIACHSPQTVFIRGIEINLQRGQFCWSQEALSKRWKWGKHKTNLFLKCLRSDGQLTLKQHHKIGIYSVLNYDKYQSDEPQTAPQTAPQTVYKQHLYNNDNNEKNDKNEELHIQRPKISNKLNISRSQELTFLKAFPGMTTTELREQAQACNTYMNMSSSNYTNPGLFFRGWLERYAKEKKAKTNEFDAAKQAQRNLPVISDEERLRNLTRLAEMKKRLGVMK